MCECECECDCDNSICHKGPILKVLVVEPCAVMYVMCQFLFLFLAELATRGVCMGNS